MKKIGFGIIGCGNIGPIHAAAIHAAPHAKLIAVSDVVEKNALKLASQYNVEPYTEYRKMLERKDIQAVSICVPSGLRAEIAEDCAKAGKHILSEKPLEVTTKRIDRIIDAADKAGVLLGCIFQSRFAEGSKLVKQAVEQNRFGKLVLGDAYIKWFRSKEYYASASWRGTWKLDGGGALMNQGIHQIDLLLWFMGPVKRVFAQTQCIVHEGLEVEDLATATIEFQNGAYGVIEGSTATWPGHPARIEVHGSEGSAVLEDGKLIFWQFMKKKPIDIKVEKLMAQETELGSGASDPLSALKIEGHRRQIEDFAQAILKGCKPTVDGREGRHAVELIETIYKSARLGKPINM